MKEIQKWKGIVEEINEKSFYAKLIDLTSGGTYEYGTFPLSDAPKDISIGRIFTWTISEKDGETKSIIEFPDLKFTDEEIKQAEKRAEKWIKTLNDENNKWLRLVEAQEKTIESLTQRKKDRENSRKDYTMLLSKFVEQGKKLAEAEQENVRLKFLLQQREEAEREVIEDFLKKYSLSSIASLPKFTEYYLKSKQG